MQHPDIFKRTELMLGTPVLDRLAGTRVAIFGLGGVGSWCAESLVRSGVGHLLLVDSDRVAVTNVNRQLMATTATLGEVKVETLARRLREINPAVSLELRAEIYSPETAPTFDLASYDYVIDAIDSLTNKAALIRHALSIPTVTLFASMGAALKLDPFQIRATPFKKIEGDGLARALRSKFKKTGCMPERSFICVWSPERRTNQGDCPQPDGVCPQAAGVCPQTAGACPQTAGVCPQTAGACPQAAGVCPQTAGVCPQTAGVCPQTAGVCPQTAGVCPQAAGVCPQAAGVCPQTAGVCPQAAGVCPPEGEDRWAKTKVQINGSIAPTVAIFGHALAALVLQHVECTVQHGEEVAR